MFKDKARVKFRSGKGGDGYIAFNRARKPSGGDGGKGGNIVLMGTLHENDLSVFQNGKVYKAGNATNGGREQSQGKDGEDLIIMVPLVTKVFDQDQNLILTVDKPNEPMLLVDGGKGGHGNFFFKKKGQLFREKATNGMDSVEIDCCIELELESDIIFIGLPNAGKSSIINEVTNANAKTAPYAFTTIDPQLGMCDDMKLMDLPGLIEKTSEGKGLGMEFVKHTKRTKMIAHFISLESEDILNDYKVIRNEIDLISDHFKALKEVIIFTKSDLLSKEALKEKIKLTKKIKKPSIITSAFDLDSLQKLKGFLKENLG